MRADYINKNSGAFGSAPRAVKVIPADAAEFLVNADTIVNDKTLTMDSEAEVFISSPVAGPGIPPGTYVTAINTGTAGTDVTSVEMNNAATATDTNIATIQVNGTNLKASDSGIIVCADLDADHHFALPAVEKGLAFEFWYNGTAADASDWHIKTRSTTNYMMGGCLGLDTDDHNVVLIDGDNNSNNHINILTPGGGTVVKLCCDGLLWYLTGTILSATDAPIVFADHV